MANYLVTGSGRGLGLELVRQLSKLPNSEVSTVFAGTRGAAPAPLQELISSSSNRIVHLKLEITEQESINAAVDQVQKIVGSKGLSVLVNNAGVMPITPNGVQNMTDLMEVVKVNVQSVQMMMTSFLPLLRQSQEKKVVNVSTGMGSISKAASYTDQPNPAYKISKAALNMLTVQYALQFADEGFTFLCLTPGWLKTDMGSEHADLPVETGAKAVLDIILRADKKSNGKFHNVHVPGWENKPGANQYDGKDVPW